MRLNAQYQQYHEMLFYIREEFGKREFFISTKGQRRKVITQYWRGWRRRVKSQESTVITTARIAFNDEIPSDYDSPFIPWGSGLLILGVMKMWCEMSMRSSILKGLREQSAMVRMHWSVQINWKKSWQELIRSTKKVKQWSMRTWNHQGILQICYISREQFCPDSELKSNILAIVSNQQVDQ